MKLTSILPESISIKHGRDEERSSPSRRHHERNEQGETHGGRKARETVDEVDKPVVTKRKQSRLLEKETGPKLSEIETTSPTEKDGGALPEGEDRVPSEEQETISEWREGRDRVIERQRGPGEDVDVEVSGRRGTNTSESVLRQTREACGKGK
ncbi:hypothetical protein L218DRAFT_665927 [Marasmius fiardii PR-910]|nr:hypothetical protein L218DRAFT_665927 [Marasmius fiardii PR-910]